MKRIISNVAGLISLMSIYILFILTAACNSLITAIVAAMIMGCVMANLIIKMQDTKFDNLYFTKLNEKAIIPSKRNGDGWYDIYACIDETIKIMPGETKLIPTGLGCVCGQAYRLSLKERGSNTKWGGQLMAGQIDSSYRGEIFVAIHNCNNVPILIGNDIYNTGLDSTNSYVTVSANKAICQLGVEPVPQMDIVVKPKWWFDKQTTDRGAGCLGSSNK